MAIQQMVLGAKTAGPPPADPTLGPPSLGACSSNPNTLCGGLSYSLTAVGVTITTITAFANLRYTVDGSTPDATTGTLISSESGCVDVTISGGSGSGTVLKAVAVKNGVASNVVSGSYYYDDLIAC